jgi:hypothetical protein
MIPVPGGFANDLQEFPQELGFGAQGFLGKRERCLGFLRHS